MSVRDTSREAFADIQPHLAPLQQKIVALITYYGRALTRNEIASLAGIAIPSVCGRVKELIDAGVLVEGAARMCKFSGKSAHEIKVAPRQIELVA